MQTGLTGHPLPSPPSPVLKHANRTYRFEVTVYDSLACQELQALEQSIGKAPDERNAEPLEVVLLDQLVQVDAAETQEGRLKQWPRLLLTVAMPPAYSGHASCLQWPRLLLTVAMPPGSHVHTTRFLFTEKPMKCKIYMKKTMNAFLTRYFMEGFHGFFIFFIACSPTFRFSHFHVLLKFP